MNQCVRKHNSDTQNNNATMASKTAAAADAAPRSILLQSGAMPNYSLVNQSKEEFSSLQERIERVLHEQPQLEKNDLSEQAVLLHSIFGQFCHPKPSVASVLDILLLERQRILIVNNNNSEDEAAAQLATSRNTIQILAAQDPNLPQSMHPSLPKEVLIHTSPDAAQSIISILTSNAKSCLLKLPLHFQLAFWRILVRLLSDETDDEFDAECLFHFRDAHGEEAERDNDGSNGCNEEILSGERRDLKQTIDDDSSSSDEDTYDIINRQYTTCEDSGILATLSIPFSLLWH